MSLKIGSVPGSLDILAAGRSFRGLSYEALWPKMKHGGITKESRRANAIILSQAPLTISSLPNAAHRSCPTKLLNVDLRAVTPTAFTIALFEAKPSIRVGADTMKYVRRRFMAMLDKWRRLNRGCTGYRQASQVLSAIELQVSICTTSFMLDQAEDKQFNRSLKESFKDGKPTFPVTRHHNVRTIISLATSYFQRVLKYMLIGILKAASGNGTNCEAA